MAEEKNLIKRGRIASIITGVFCYIVLTVVLMLTPPLMAMVSSYDVSFEDNINYGYNSCAKDAFIAQIEYKKDTETTISLPDKFKGYKITALGGTSGCGHPNSFGVLFNEQEYFADVNIATYYFASEEWLISKYETENARLIVTDVTFNITLPRYLEDVYYSSLEFSLCGEILDVDDSTTIYVVRPIYYFTISEENENFYCQDGKLYQKKNDKLIKNVNYNAWAL